MPIHRNVDSLLRAPASAELGRQLLGWVTELRGRILAGEMMIGILSVEEVEKAPAALRMAAECGVEEAWLELGTWYAQPPFGAPDFVSAEGTLKSAISSGIPGAALRLVMIRWALRRDDLAPEERAETFNLLNELVNSEPANGEALYYLGLLTFAGFGTQASQQAAFALQQSAAALGNADAMFEMYVQLQGGLGVEKDESAAFAANRRAAEAGHARALYNMGAFYATGRHVGRDLAQAANWYDRAADAGSVRALATLAAMYATGEGVSKDTERAKQLFEEADYLGLDVTDLRASVGL